MPLKFPLIFQFDQIKASLRTWLSNCSAKAIESKSKEDRPLLVTAAPTGSGKTMYLAVLYELFRLKWDAAAFAQLHALDKENAEYLTKMIESIVTDPEIVVLINETGLSKSLLSSTFPCFVSFYSRTSVTCKETEIFNDRPSNILIARVIFSLMKRYDDDWKIEYENFLEANEKSLLRIYDLTKVVRYIKQRYGCQHFMLAVDELIKLNSDKNINYVNKVMRDIGCLTFSTDGVHSVISSLITKPLQEYYEYSQHVPVFIQLCPLVQNLHTIGKYIMKNRKDSSGDKLVMSSLLASGGHPLLISNMIRFLVETDLHNLNIKNACERTNFAISIDDPLLRIIINGDAAPRDFTVKFCSSGGMLT